jgi:hypothetical protein
MRPIRLAEIVVTIVLATLAMVSVAPAAGATTPAGLANLRLDSWGYGYNCDFFFGGVSATVTNTGSEVSSDFAILLELDDDVFAWLYQPRELGPGESANLGPSGTRDIVLGEGTHTFKVLVDPGDRVPESNDLDNLGVNVFEC